MITSRQTMLKLPFELWRVFTKRRNYSKLHPEAGYRYESPSSRHVRILLYGHYRITYLVKPNDNIDILGVFGYRPISRVDGETGSSTTGHARRVGSIDLLGLNHSPLQRQFLYINRHPRLGNWAPDAFAKDIREISS